MRAFTEITAKVEGGVGTLTFDRQDRRNALSLEMFADLGDCLEEWAKDDDVACVVITGGSDVFCAGLDLKLQAVFTDETRASYSQACLRVYGALLDYPKPTIAAVGGAALGGGCDIAVFCDIRVGATNAVLGFPQIKMGLTPYFSPLWKIVGLSQAKLLTFSGDRIGAAEALRIGLLDRLVEPTELSEAVARLARSIADTGTASAVNNKEMARRSPAMDPISALTYETLAYREVIHRPEVISRVDAALRRLGSAKG